MCAIPGVQFAGFGASETHRALFSEAIVASPFSRPATGVIFGAEKSYTAMLIYAIKHMGRQARQTEEATRRLRGIAPECADIETRLSHQ
jgi:hypothetical protein